MTKSRKTAADQLQRLAKESSAAQSDRASAAAPTAAGDERLEALIRNIGRIVMLPLTELWLGENVRKYMPVDTPEFAQLVDSVRREGVLQNLVAELQIQNDHAWRLSIVSGQRRYLAAERAGVRMCPVRIVQFTDHGSRIAQALSENILRDNLHCLDQAEAYAELLREGWTEEQIAETFDRRRQTVMQHLRLARYPEEAKQVIRGSHESFSSFDLLNRFVAHRWPDTDTLVAALRVHAEKRNSKPTRARTGDDLRKLGRELNSRTGYKVSVSGTNAAGQLAIRWFSKADQIALFKLLRALERQRTE